jgi:type VI secretion system secreted protein VgrG
MSCNDTKGKEGVTIHAQYDMKTTVQHDDTQRVVTGNRKIDVETGTHTETVNGAVTETYKANQSTTVTNQIEVKSSTAHIHLTASTNITLTVGSSSLLMRNDGYIELNGVTIVVKGTNSITQDGGSIRSIAKEENETKGMLVISEGTATNTVKGGMVMLNP